MFTELSKDQKKALKKARLEQFRAQIHELEITIVASEAIGDATGAEICRKKIEEYKKAYDAVEKM